MTKQVVIPPYIDREAWDGFVEMRKKMKWALTDRAITLILNKLQEIAARGGDPNAALDQSVERCYRGVFEVAEPKGLTNGNLPAGKANQNLAVLQRAIDRRKRDVSPDQDGLFPSGDDGRRDTGSLHVGPKGS